MQLEILRKVSNLQNVILCLAVTLDMHNEIRFTFLSTRKPLTLPTVLILALLNKSTELLPSTQSRIQIMKVILICNNLVVCRSF